MLLRRLGSDVYKELGIACWYRIDKMEAIELIKKYKEKIFNRLSEDKKSFNDYKFILSEFRKGNVNKGEFRRVYKRFYVLNGAGLTPRFIDRYFELLAKKERNLRKILWELSKIPRRKGDYSVQLSFASKLIHTIDNTQPIYDSRVARILNIKLAYNKDINKKIDDRVAKYNLLKKKFNEIINDKQIGEIIKNFKKRLGVDIGDVKMLDFILWKLGSIVIKEGK